MGPSKPSKTMKKGGSIKTMKNHEKRDPLTKHEVDTHTTQTQHNTNKTKQNKTIQSMNKK